MRTAGRIIREKREKMGLTVEDLAAYVHVSKATMSRTETGQRIPPDHEIQAIADILELECPSLISAFDAQRQANADAKALFTVGGLFSVLGLLEETIDDAENIRVQGLPYWAIEMANKALKNIQPYMLSAAEQDKPALYRLQAKGLIVRAAGFTMTVTPSLVTPPHLEKHIRLGEINALLPYLKAPVDDYYLDLGIALPAMSAFLVNRYDLDKVWRPSDFQRLSGAYVRGLILRDQIVVAAMKKQMAEYERLLREANQMARLGLLDWTARARIFEGQAIGMIYLGLAERDVPLNNAEKFYRRAVLSEEGQPFVGAQIARTRIYHLVKQPHLDEELVCETAKSEVHQLQVGGYRRHLTQIKRILLSTKSKRLMNLAASIIP